VAYKTVVSNGLVLDKVGQKMSKRLGNAVDPFKTLDQYGADAVRWYMISNASPWDNLKFDAEGITEVQRKFFRALFNTYNFFALYANIDGFDGNSVKRRLTGGDGERPLDPLAPQQRDEARRCELRRLRADHRRTCHPGLRGGGPEQLVCAPQPPSLLEGRAGRRQERRVPEHCTAAWK
jgi:hypothetical protein